MGNLSKYRFVGAGLEKDEKKSAKKLFDGYRRNYSIDALSDLNLLEELTYREILQERYKIKISEVSKSKTVNDQNIIPGHVLKALNENLTQILTLKEKLGLFSDKKEDSDAFKHLETLKKKFKIWLKENQGSRTLACPHCSKMIMLRIRTKAWEAQKHPMFRDRILCNDHLVKLFMEKKITADDCAKMLGTSKDYIKWLIEKWYENAKKS